ncbi:peptidase inhibitor family I36 protein [Nonomuraea sp. CA-143628]|uniref:peptidase inhibitor family I36 protein n=1 Tax=Nonomuraea sp. CA-143628 TaxID=3239997 RepID=UPI003D8E60E9
MQNSRRTAIAIAAFAALLGAASPSAAAASQSTSSAATSLVAPPCAQGLVCAWTEQNYAGSRVSWYPPTSGYCWGTGGVSQAFYSVWNATSSIIRVWELPNCTGRNAFVDPQSGQPITPFPVRALSPSAN